MQKEILHVQNLVKRRGSVLAVDDISFSVNSQSLLSILGPNGAGKTTTLECIEGLLHPDSGRIGITADRIGIQLQNSSLPKALTVNEAMRLFCAYRNVPARYDLLKRFGLNDRGSSEFSKLSVGQQRRLALALALIHDPELLFLDEPSAGLDVANRVELHSIIRELKTEGRTIILATHDMAEAETLSDRIIIMLNGKIVEDSSPMELTSAAGTYSKITVKSENNSLLALPPDSRRITEKQTTDGYTVFFCTEAGETAGFILDWINKNNDRLIDFRIERPSLEERFIEITGAAQ